MRLDREDKLFVQVVGSKAARTLKTRNIRLWNAFRERCQENSEKPEAVLGRILLKFVNSVLDGDEFHEELLDKTINVSALVKRKGIADNLKEFIELKKALTESESDEIDKLIHRLIATEIEKASKSPIEAITQESQPAKDTVVTIDENLLYQLDPASLDALAKMAEKVKMDKMKAMQATAEQIEEVIAEENEMFESVEEPEIEEEEVEINEEVGEEIQEAGEAEETV